ncbi:zinc finger protein 572-like [Toxorhynchites rutilus septentrionalis]|uniref:zinc finger protein 572-like n=1 Tax=Toxorhynchites rutilus septentrionalis TaxID=329112 RepID=UPI00247B173D|nr:zinc finger protein 572-like [Toxorhynchites rutilus septentrionalis]
MSLSVIKLLVNNHSRVCRFCLESNPEKLSDVYEQILGESNVASISITIRNVLSVLGLQITLDDPHPKLICRHCREFLFAIHDFREESLQSIQLLDKARLLKEFPDVTFDDIVEGDSVIGESEHKSEHSVSNEVEEEGIVEALEEESENGDIPLTTTLTEEEVVVNPENGDRIDIKEEELYVEQTKEERDESEWIMFEEIEIGEEQEDDMEPIYLEEEQDSHQEFDQTLYSSSTMTPADQESQSNACVEVDPSETYKPSASKKCPICGITSTSMVVHMRTHTKIRPFVCEICSKGFYTSNKLRSHISSVHHKERNFRCEICGKAFSMKKTLNAHMMSHLAEKSHVCTMCSKSFLFRWALAKHERTHTGERPFVCTLDGCGKSFASSSNLRQHQKTGAHWKQPREDVCKECDKVFQSKYALRAHKKIHEQRRASATQRQVH